MPGLVAILLIVALMALSWYRDDLRKITRDYATRQPFHGSLERCLIRFPMGEAPTICALSADNQGLYISPPTDAMKSTARSSYGYYAMKTSVMIPWDDLQITPAKFPLRKYLRFTVRSSQAMFFVPRDTASLLILQRGK